MTATTRQRSRRWIPALIGVIATLGLGLFFAFSIDRPESCACPIPESADSAIETAISFVAAGDQPGPLLHPDAEAPDAEQAADLAALDDPGTEWVVLATQRNGDDYGRSPAERIILGISSEGGWATLLVHTADDYELGTVDPDVDESGHLEDFVHRSGPYPVFGNVDSIYRSAPDVTLLEPGTGEVVLERLHNKGAWAYSEAGPLTGDRYLLASARQHNQTEQWVVSTVWWDPEDPAEEE